MSLYSDTSLPEAMRMAASDVDDFFASKAFKDHQKSKEAEMKLQSAVIDRLDSLARMMSRRHE